MKKKDLDKSLKYIESWLDFRFKQEDIPGFVVAVSYKGKVIFNVAHGYADVENNTEMTEDNIFRIASHSKTFTATSIMQLQEMGKLRIDDYIVDYLEWLNKHEDERWKKVTIRQLLSHGAGVIRDGKNADYWQLERPFPSRDDLKKEILEAKLVLEVNEKLKYSNFGYSLLGLLIEKVSGEDYSVYVSENIVSKLGLKNTGAELDDSIDSRLVTGYTRMDIKRTRLPIENIDTRSMAAATGFYSTAEDLCEYFSSQFVGSKKLLSDETKKEMQRVHYRAVNPGQDNEEDYGLGFEIEHLGDRKTIGHGGGFPGQITKSIADPKNELVVVALSNCLGGPAHAIAKGIFRIFDYFEQNSSDAKPKHDYSKFEGRYIGLWGVTDLVATSNKIVSVYPGWRPFDSTEELEYIDGSTLKIKKTGSFYSEGELVTLDGSDNTINYSGSTMWQEDEWYRKIRNITKIKLEE